MAVGTATTETIVQHVKTTIINDDDDDLACCSVSLLYLFCLNHLIMLIISYL